MSRRSSACSSSVGGAPGISANGAAASGAAAPPSPSILGGAARARGAARRLRRGGGSGSRGGSRVRGRGAARGTPPPEATIRGDGDDERVDARIGGGGVGLRGVGSGGAKRRARMSRPERMSKNGRQIRSASPSATGRLAMSSGSRRLGGIAPALAAHLGVESRRIGDFSRASRLHCSHPLGSERPNCSFRVRSVAQPGARRVRPRRPGQQAVAPPRGRFQPAGPQHGGGNWRKEEQREVLWWSDTR